MYGGQMRSYRVSVRKTEVKPHLEGLWVDGDIIMKMVGTT